MQQYKLYKESVYGKNLRTAMWKNEASKKGVCEKTQDNTVCEQLQPLKSILKALSMQNKTRNNGVFVQWINNTQ